MQKRFHRTMYIGHVRGWMTAKMVRHSLSSNMWEIDQCYEVGVWSVCLSFCLQGRGEGEMFRRYLKEEVRDGWVGGWVDENQPLSSESYHLLPFLLLFPPCFLPQCMLNEIRYCEVSFNFKMHFTARRLSFFQLETMSIVLLGYKLSKSSLWMK